MAGNTEIVRKYVGWTKRDTEKLRNLLEKWRREDAEKDAKNPEANR